MNQLHINKCQLDLIDTNWYELDEDDPKLRLCLPPRHEYDITRVNLQDFTYKDIGDMLVDEFGSDSSGLSLPLSWHGLSDSSRNLDNCVLKCNEITHKRNLKR